MERLRQFLFTNISPRQIVFKNTFWLYLAEIISKGTKLLVFIFVIRFLGPHKYGVFEYLFSFVGMFFLFVDFGISTIFIRDYQQKEEKEKLFGTFCFLRIFLAFLFGLLALSGFLFIKKDNISFLLYLLFVLFYTLASLDNFFEAYFTAVQKLEKKFIFNFFSSLVLILGVIIGLIIYRDIFVVALAYLLSSLTTIFIASLLLKRETKIFLFLDKNLIKYYLYNGLPLVFLGVLGYVFFSTDKIILAYLRPFEEVGYYSLASRIISILFVIPGLFNAALYPYLAQKVVQKDHRLFIWRLFKLVFLGSILLAIFISFLVLLLDDFLIFLLFGKNYLFSLRILNVFIWILVFVYPTIFLNNFLIINHKQWLTFWLSLLPAILNIVLNIVMIPIYGLYGAVYSSIIAQSLNFTFLFVASLYIFKKNSL
jgi:O-antigen/teichoic acid export membrane protein